MTSTETRKDPFYADYYNTFGTYPNKEEHELWRCLSAPFTMLIRLEVPKEKMNGILAQSVGITAKDMGMPYPELFKLIESVAHEYYQACQNYRVPMQFIYLGNLIPDKYAAHKHSIAILALTYLEQMLGQSRFDPPTHSAPKQ